jgi:PAS domain S-box-containing protein
VLTPTTPEASERVPSPELSEAIREAAPVEAAMPWLLVGPTGALLDAGPALGRLVGMDVSSLRGLQVDAVLCDEDAGLVRELLERSASERHADARLVSFKDEAGRRHSVRAQIAPHRDGLLIVGAIELAAERKLHDQLHQMSAELAVLAREHRKQARDLERALEERERSYWHLRRIQEVLPICMDCGTVKPGSDWVPLVDYLKANSILFSHGMCADCFEKREAELEHG